MARLIDAISRLTQAGINPSVQRIQVLDYFLNYKTHPTAETIYAHLRQDMPAISKATVYNTLSLFEEKGLVTVFATDQGKARYDLIEYPHGHFICQSCGQATNVSYEIDYDPIIEGFEVQSEELVIRGICDKCLAKMKGAL